MRISIFFLLFTFINSSGFSQSIPYDSITTIPAERGVVTHSIQMDERGKKLYIAKSNKVQALSIKKNRLKEWSFERDESIEKAMYPQAQLSKNGRYLVYYNLGKEVCIYRKRRKSYQLKTVLEHPSKSERNIPAIAFDKTERYLLTGEGHGELYLWDLRKGELIKKVETKTTGAVYSVAFSNNGEKIAVGTGASECLIIDLKTDSILSKLEIKYKTANEYFSTQIPSHIEFSDNDSTVFMKIYNDHHTLMKWDINAPRFQVWSSKDYKPSSFQYAQNKVIMGDLGGYISILDASNRKQLDYFRIRDRRSIKHLKLSPSLKYLAIQNIHGRVTLFKAKK